MDHQYSSFEISVARTSKGLVTFRIRDSISGVHLFDADMTVEDFGKLITGLADQPLVGTIKSDVSMVGKIRKVVEKSVSCPLPRDSSKEDIFEWLQQNCQEEGWEVIASLSARGAITWNNDGSQEVRYQLVRYI